MAVGITVALELDSSQTAADMAARLQHDDVRRDVREIVKLIEAVAATTKDGIFRDGVHGAFASQTITCDQSAAVDGTDDITIAAGATTATISVEASPSGENQMDSGTTDAEFADNLEAKINAHSTLSLFVRASSDGASVVTVYSLLPGVLGNGVTLAETGLGFTLGGANLAGGATTAVQTKAFGLAES